jgi:acyl-ACP thioesterase
LKNGKTVAEAYSVWALLDLVRQKLLPTSEFPYEIEPEVPLGAELTARVRFPSTAGMELIGDRKIVYSDIDYNGHMNNTHYPNMLCDFTPDILSKNVTGFTLSFLHEAAFGHTLKVYRSEREGGGYFFRTQDEAGNVCLEAMLLTEEKQSLGEKKPQ